MSHHKGPQGDMFAEFTRSRTRDPWTSKAAAAEIIPKLRKLQRQVYEDFLKEASERGRGMTSYEVESIHNDYGSTYRTRISELVELGLLRDTGCTREFKGRRRVIYMLNDPTRYQY